MKEKIGSKRRRTGAEVEEEELIFNGPIFRLTPQQGTGMSNQKSPGPNTVELIFAPAAASLVFEGEEDFEDPVANEGYDPDEPRIPAGQPGGSQWTRAGAGEAVQGVSGRRQLPAAKPAPAPTPGAGRRRATPPAAVGPRQAAASDDDDSRTIGQAAEEIFQTFLRDLAGGIRELSFRMSLIANPRGRRISSSWIRNSMTP